MADLIATFFDMPQLVIEAIPVDEQAVYEKHALSIYERVKALKDPTPTSVTSEAITAGIHANRVQFLTLPITERTLTVPDIIQPAEISRMESVTVCNNTYHVPIPHANLAQKWNDRVLPYRDEVLEQIGKVSEFDKSVQARITEIDAFVNVTQIIHRSQVVKDNFSIMLTTILYEKLLKEKIRQFSEQCQAITVTHDYINHGLWMTDGEQTVKPTIVPRAVIPLQRRFRFDSRSTRLLVTLAFSKNNAERASAKLDLGSKINQEILGEVFSRPAQTLAIVLSEAQIVGAEAAAIIYPTKQNSTETICLCCNVAVNITGMVIHHQKCETVEWLCTYQPYKYCSDDRCLVPIRKALISPDNRRKISELLSLHHKLNNDIVIRTSGETTIWKRNENGTLTKQALRTVRPDEQVGTHAWKVRHGFSPHR